MKAQKITIFGDMMCEPRLLSQAKRENGYDYAPTFVHLKKLIQEADYTIGNLETPLAGEEAGYTSRIVSFNAPDAFAEAIREVGFDFVSTANNHALDRGTAGVKRTLEALDKIGLAHSGSFADGNDAGRIYYFTLGDTKLALLCFSYGTNYAICGNAPEPGTINYLRPYNAKGMAKAKKEFTGTKDYVESLLGREMSWEEKGQLKLAMGLSTASSDDEFDADVETQHLRELDTLYAEARSKADLVFLLPHTGGQFNEKPGAYSEFLMEHCASLGFDGIFAAHSHTTQKAVYLHGAPCFFCLGNVTMTPCTWYSWAPCLPQFGIAAHLYLIDKKIQKVTFSIFRILDPDGGQLAPVPIDELLPALMDEQEKALLLTQAEAVWQRVSGRTEGFTVQREYEL